MKFTETFITLILFATLIVVIPIVLVALYIAWIHLKFWICRKFTFLSIGLIMIYSKHKALRAIGWQSLRLFIWESKE